MARIVPYRRRDALGYAEKWAMGRNPQYMNLSGIGGDCTNFCSQCLFAGCGIMNRTQDTGWYYISPNDRSPAWTGVKFFRRFLLENQGRGPFAEETELEALLPGDFILLNGGSYYYHALIVVGRSGEMPLVAAHTYDAYMRPLSAYSYAALSPLHILGARD